MFSVNSVSRLFSNPLSCEPVTRNSFDPVFMSGVPVGFRLKHNNWGKINLFLVFIPVVAALMWRVSLDLTTTLMQQHSRCVSLNICVITNSYSVPSTLFSCSRDLVTSHTLPPIKITTSRPKDAYKIMAVKPQCLESFIWLRSRISMLQSSFSWDSNSSSSSISGLMSGCSSIFSLTHFTTFSFVVSELLLNTFILIPTMWGFSAFTICMSLALWSSTQV